MPDDLKIAWAAGLFEGEGCFSYSQKRARASMTSTDLDVLEKFQKIVGCGNVYSAGKQEKPHHKVKWQWAANGDDFVKVFTLLRPWLCSRRLAAGQKALKLREKLHASFCKQRQCEHCGELFFPSPRGDSTQAKMAGAMRMRFCCSGCRVDAKNARRRLRDAFVASASNITECWK